MLVVTGELLNTAEPRIYKLRGWAWNQFEPGPAPVLRGFKESQKIDKKAQVKSK
jgi:hypothetical protein